jgi:hypothetical protein
LNIWKRQAETSAALALRTRTAPAGPTASFQKIEKLMPNLMREMREDLTNRPLSREFVLLKRCWSYWSKGYELEYYYDDHDQLESMVRVLQNHGLVSDITNDSPQRYIMSEELAEYLTT